MSKLFLVLKEPCIKIFKIHSNGNKWQLGGENPHSPAPEFPGLIFPVL